MADKKIKIHTHESVRPFFDYGIEPEVVKELWILNYIRVALIGNSVIRGIFCSFYLLINWETAEPSAWGDCSILTFLFGAVLWGIMADIEIEQPAQQPE